MINKQYFLRKAWLFFPVVFFGCTSTTETKNTEGQTELDESTVNCYESISSNSNQRSTSHEYIVFWNDNGIITGKGSGYDEGEPLWEFDFSGSQVNDSLIKVQVRYQQEDIAPLNTHETWVIDVQNENMKLKDVVEKHSGASKRPGANSYFKIEPADIPSGFQQLLEK